MHDPPLSHVTTFGGHPVSCAAAYATLHELLSDDYEAKAKAIESTVRKILRADGIKEIRGRGAMLGMQLTSRRVTRRVVADCFEKGIILGWTLHSDTLVRLAPPLTIDRVLLEETLYGIVESVKSQIKLI